MSLTALSSTILGNTHLDNRIVMAPMTRSRAINNIPNNLMALYYGQRAAAGLIITEGVSPSPNGLGYARMPGIFTIEQVNGWKLTTNAVHKKGGKIFMQLMHSGRVGHSYNLPAGARIIAPSAITAAGKIWTDKDGMQTNDHPEEMTDEDILDVKAEFIQAARNAIAAGFDGIELHSANGYLLEQFLSPHSNVRIDNYGGSIKNRIRLVLEIAEEVGRSIGFDKVGIRLSPYGIANDMPHYAEIDETYIRLAAELNRIGIAYIHLVDHSSGGAPVVPSRLKREIRSLFKNTLILSGGYTLMSAEDDINAGHADLVAFGKPFISNPDLVERFKKNFPLNIKLDASTFYAAGPKGFTDYPVFEEELVGVLS